MSPEGSKIQAQYFRQAWIRSVRASVMEFRLCDGIEASKRTLQIRLFVKFVKESPHAIWLEESL